MTLELETCPPKPFLRNLGMSTPACVAFPNISPLEPSLLGTQAESLGPENIVS